MERRTDRERIGGGHKCGEKSRKNRQRDRQNGRQAERPTERKTERQTDMGRPTAGRTDSVRRIQKTHPCQYLIQTNSFP